MALAYLLDEHLRGPLWNAIQRHNSRGSDALDVVRIGDVNAPSLGADDSAILIWAEQADRILVTLDESTLPTHLEEHLRAGNHSPGIFTIRPTHAMANVVEYLVLAAHASEAAEWADRITYIP